MMTLQWTGECCNEYRRFSQLKRLMSDESRMSIETLKKLNIRFDLQKTIVFAISVAELFAHGILEKLFPAWNLVRCSIENDTRKSEWNTNSR